MIPFDSTRFASNPAGPKGPASFARSAKCMEWMRDGK